MKRDCLIVWLKFAVAFAKKIRKIATQESKELAIIDLQTEFEYSSQLCIACTKNRIHLNIF